MAITSLSNEILLLTADALDFTWDIYSLARANRGFYALLMPYIYRRDTRDFLCSILIWAAIHGKELTARKFLNETRDIVIEEVIWHAIELAALNGHDAVVRLFLEEATSSNLSDSDGWEETSLLLAVENGHVAVARTILARGAKASLDDCELLCDAINSPEGLAMVKLLVEEGHCDYKLVGYPRPALSEAASRGQTEIVRYLLQLGCDIECQDEDLTPICIAAESSYIETVRCLIEHGANTNPGFEDGTTLYPVSEALKTTT